MDGKLTYELQDNILYLKAKGDYSAQEFIELWKNALNDSLVPRRFGVVVDARHSKTSHRIADIKPIHDELRKWNERIARIAVVVQSDQHFGFTRQCSVYDELDGRDVNPFYEIESAIDWVNEKLKSDPTCNNTMHTC